MNGQNNNNNTVTDAICGRNAVRELIRSGKPVDKILVQRGEREGSIRLVVAEAVAAGTVKLAGVEYDEIVRMASELLEQPTVYRQMAQAVNPYGDGNACTRIADAIAWHFGNQANRPENFQP